MERYRIVHNDSGEPVEIAGEIDHHPARVQAYIGEHRRFFDQASSPEPYAPWGLSVFEVIYDEYDQRVILKQVDWREIYFEYDSRATTTEEAKR